MRATTQTARAALGQLGAIRAAIVERMGPAGGPAARTWRDINMAVRTALVMLAIDSPIDAREFARRPWASYTSDEQVALGAVAREFARELTGAGALR